MALSAVQEKVIYRDGEFTNVDYRDYFGEVNKHTEDIGKRAKKNLTKINGTNSFHEGRKTVDVLFSYCNSM